MKIIIYLLLFISCRLSLAIPPEEPVSNLSISQAEELLFTASNSEQHQRIRALAARLKRVITLIDEHTSYYCSQRDKKPSIIIDDHQDEADPKLS